MFSSFVNNIKGNNITIRSNGNNIIINNGKIFIDGVEQNIESNIKNITIVGNVNNVECDQSLNIEGDVGNVNAKGSVNCDNITGDVVAGGSINADDITAHTIQAGGSINADDISYVK